jgi:hypothetical protein
MILNWILERLDGVVWTGLIGLRIGKCGNRLANGNEPSGSIKYWQVVE